MTAGAAWRIGVVLLALAGAVPARGDEAPATITSDQLELQNNGELTIFSGRVVLRQTPYEVRADRMLRVKATEVVHAKGRVIGTWISAKNERVRVESDEARFEPARNTVEAWGKKQVAVHLESEKGKALFYGDRGWVFTLTPGRARLAGNVRGHITPKEAS